MYYIKKGYYGEIVVLLCINNKDIEKVKRIDKEANVFCNNNNEIENLRKVFIGKLGQNNIKYKEICKEEIFVSDFSTKEI